MDTRALSVRALVLLLGCFAPTLEAASVTGRVENRSGNPVSNARVTLFDGTLETFREVRTDAQGVYSMEGLEGGSYRLGVSAIDFEYQEVELALGTTATARDFFLGPEEHPGRWTITGNTLPDFLDATDIAILTPEGKVFYCHSTDDPLLFDPVKGEKSFPSGSGTEQGCMNGTLLENGQIIIVGGQNPTSPGSFRNAIRWVKTYSFSENSWDRLSDLRNTAGRWYPGLA